MGVHERMYFILLVYYANIKCFHLIYFPLFFFIYILLFCLHAISAYIILFNCKKALIVTPDAIMYNPPLQSQPNLCSVSHMGTGGREWYYFPNGAIFYYFIIQYFIVSYCFLCLLACLYFVFIVIFVAEVFERPFGGDSPQ